MVRTTDEHGCVNQYSKELKATATVELQYIPTTEHFSIYQKPSTGIVNIKDTYLSSRTFEVFILDFMGRVILYNKTVYQFNLSEYGKGAYTIIIYTEDGQVQQRDNIGVGHSI